VDRTSAFNFCQAVSHEMAGREVIAPEGSSLADLRDAIERVSEVDILPNYVSAGVQERASPLGEKEGPIRDLLNRGQES
jgi:hypothetical protein